jgi:peptidoglycan hydrolase CwlO-like protein
MKYEGNKVVISEAEIRYLVKESVKNYLRENAEDEGFFRTLWNGSKGAVGAGMDKLKQGVNTMGAAYYNTAANNEIQRLNQLATQYQEKLNQIQTQIETLQQKAQGRQNAANRNAENFRNRFQKNYIPDYNVTVNGENINGQ